MNAELTEARRIARHVGSTLAQDTLALLALGIWVPGYIAACVLLAEKLNVGAL